MSKARLSKKLLKELLEDLEGQGNLSWDTFAASAKNALEVEFTGRYYDHLDKFGTGLEQENFDLSTKTQKRLKSIFEEYTAEAPVVGGRISSPDNSRESTKAEVMIFTSAQNNTRVHKAFWDNLLAYAEYRDAEIHVSRFTYNKAALGAAGAKRSKSSDKQDAWWDPELDSYLSDQSVNITDDLVWCGELNILPTKVNPISGFQTYTRNASSIIPHAKMFMESVPTMKHEPVKMVYTTGAVTQRNYIEKTAGQIADFHHVFGALIVEVDRVTGDWWARQINTDDTGDFYDLTHHISGGEVLEENVNVQAITHGDLHGIKMDSNIIHAVFGWDGVVDQLQPEEQFFHDSIDFHARNHHNINDPHFLFKTWADGSNSVLGEFRLLAEFLQVQAARFKKTKTFLVVSNHDMAIDRWLKNPAGQFDPVNAKLWHECNLHIIRCVEEGKKPKSFSSLLHRSIQEYVGTDAGTRAVFPTFIEEDESYKILGNIEAGLHGHLGPNGARGSPRNLKTVGKANTGHTHTAGIFQGIYTAGVYGNLDLGYNKGLSSWSNSMVVTYKNSKRAILTIKNGRAYL